MKKLIYIYLVLSVSICFSQTRERSILIQELKQASVNKPDSIVYKYELAKAYSVVGEVDSAFKYLFIATKDDSTAFIIDNQDFYNLTLDKRWNFFLDAQINKIEVFNKFVYKDKAATKVLWTIGIRDQAFYNIIDSNEKKYGVSCRENDSIWQIKMKLNIVNLIVLEKIISQHGWPKYSDFGTLAGRNAFFVIQHSMYGKQKKYLPMLEEACKNGEAEWSGFALMKDRTLKIENKPQIYGSQIDQNWLTKSYELYPIEDEIHVNERRDSMEMEPIEDYVKRYGIVYVKPIAKQNNWDYRHCCILVVLFLSAISIGISTKFE